MSDIDLLLVLIPGLPLSAAVVTAVFGKHVLGRQSHWPTVLAIGLSFLASLVLLVDVWQESRQSAEAAQNCRWRAGRWASSGWYGCGLGPR